MKSLECRAVPYCQVAPENDTLHIRYAKKSAMKLHIENFAKIKHGIFKNKDIIDKGKNYINKDSWELIFDKLIEGNFPEKSSLE